MQKAINLFEERSAEIDFYYDILLQIEEKQPNIKTSDNVKFEKILKSNFLLMLYNLIEACIREGFKEVYLHISDSKNAYTNLISEIQQVWSNFEITPPSSKSDKLKSETYQQRVDRILKTVILNEEIKLDEKYLALRGNLDARYIRELLDKHNITYSDKTEKNKIHTIKHKRNELAHGHVSFENGARDYTITELSSFKNEVFEFIKSTLDSMSAYCNNKLFLSK